MSLDVTAWTYAFGNPSLTQGYQCNINIFDVDRPWLSRSIGGTIRLFLSCDMKKMNRHVKNLGETLLKYTYIRDKQTLYHKKNIGHKIGEWLFKKFLIYVCFVQLVVMVWRMLFETSSCLCYQNDNKYLTPRSESLVAQSCKKY